MEQITRVRVLPWKVLNPRSKYVECTHSCPHYHGINILSKMKRYGVRWLVLLYVVPTLGKVKDRNDTRAKESDGLVTIEKETPVRLHTCFLVLILAPSLDKRGPDCTSKV